MDRRDFYFRQKVTEGELDEAFDDVEESIWKLIGDLGFIGVATGLEVTQQASPNMTVQVSEGVAYQQDGKRIEVPTLQNLNCALDENGISTTVAGVGNSRKLSIFLEWDRSLSDPRTDGNSNTVYYDRLETFALNVAMSAEGVSPTLPPLRADQILLADVTLIYGQTSVTTSDISTARRVGTFSVTDSPRSINASNVLDALTQVLGHYNDHVTGAQDKHPAADVTYAGGTAWLDGTTNPATTVELQFDKIITDLSSSTSTSSGGRKVGLEALAAAWADAAAVASGTVYSVINAIVSTLAGSAGTAKIGGAAYAGAAYSLIAGTLQSQLRGIVDNVVGLTGTQSISGAKTFSSNVSLSGTAKVRYSPARSTTIIVPMNEARGSTGGGGPSAGDWVEDGDLGIHDATGGGTAWLSLNKYLPEGANITAMGLRCSTDASTRIRFRYQEYAVGSSVSTPSYTSDVNNSSTGAHTLAHTLGGNRTVNKATTIHEIEVTSLVGSTVNANILYYLSITFDDPGP